MPSPTPSRAGGLLALLGVILAWALTPLILKYFAGIMDAWTVNGMRYILTALFWLPWVIRRLPSLPERRGIWRDAMGPALFHMLGQAGWGLAPYFNDASVMNFVSRLSFLLTVAAGLWLLREERVLARRPSFWTGVVATVLGLAALFGGGLRTGGTSPAGMGILVWTSCCWCGYAILVRRRMRRYPIRVAFGVVSLLVAPGLAAAMFALGDWRALAALSLPQWTLLAASAWIAIALGHVMYYRSLQSLGPVITEGALALVPFVTAVAARFTLGEHMNAAQWLGGALLVSATYFLLRARRIAAMPAAA